MVPSLIAGRLTTSLSIVQITGGYGVLALVATLVTVLAARSAAVTNRGR